MQERHKPYPGLFITFEGGEGAGKTTLIEKLSVHFQKEGYPVMMEREPGGTALSEHLRNLLFYPPTHIKISGQAELLLYLAARAEHIEERILPALREGKLVLCDRFNDSTVAYQGAARKLGMDYVDRLCNLVTQDLIPDCTLLLDLDPEVGMKRIEEAKRGPLDRLEQERLYFHKEVRSAYLHLADKYPNRITLIDAALPIDEVMKCAVTAISPHLLLKPR